MLHRDLFRLVPSASTLDLMEKRLRRFERQRRRLLEMVRKWTASPTERVLDGDWCDGYDAAMEDLLHILEPDSRERRRVLLGHE